MTPNPQAIIADILRLSSAGVVFVPRALTFLHGHPENAVRAHCIHLTKLGKLKQIQSGAQNFYKISPTRQLGDHDTGQPVPWPNVPTAGVTLGPLFAQVAHDPFKTARQCQPAPVPQHQSN